MGNILLQFQEASQHKRMTVKQILVPCSLALHTSRCLHSTTLLCLFAEGSSQSWYGFWCRESSCFLTISYTGNTALSKGSSLEWWIKQDSPGQHTAQGKLYLLPTWFRNFWFAPFFFVKYITFAVVYTLTPAFTQRDLLPWKAYGSVSLASVIPHSSCSHLSSPAQQKCWVFLTLGNT